MCNKEQTHQAEKASGIKHIHVVQLGCSTIEPYNASRLPTRGDSIGSKVIIGLSVTPIYLYESTDFAAVPSYLATKVSIVSYPMLVRVLYLL